MKIDTATIYIILLVGNFFTVLLTGTYAVNHHDKRINLYIFGKGTEFAGFMVLLMRDWFPFLLSISP